MIGAHLGPAGGMVAGRQSRPGDGQPGSDRGTGGMATDLFALAESRLTWIGQRQNVLAQNIANADTPDYQARDVTPFEKLLRVQPLTAVATNPAHLQGNVWQAALTRTVPSGRSADGNAVEIEDELTKVAQDETDQALVSNLWKTYMGFYLSALGKAG
jgi:flagellar basal-body rod protein FlgB